MKSRPRIICLLLLVVGCGSASTEQRVAQTAAAAWHCPEKKVTVNKLSADMYRAQGCDQEADYSCTDEAGKENDCVNVSGQ